MTKTKTKASKATKKTRTDVVLKAQLSDGGVRETTVDGRLNALDALESAAESLGIPVFHAMRVRDGATSELSMSFLRDTSVVDAADGGQLKIAPYSKFG
jgi:hypothetical protein